MNHFYCTLLFILAYIPCSYASAKWNTLPDSIISEDAVYEYTFTDYDKACRIMKELRKQGNLPHYTLDMTEGDLYYNTGHSYQALKFYNQALDSDSARLDPHNEMKVLHRLISCYDYLKLDTQKSEYVERLLKKAKECGNRAMHSTALFELGKMMYYQGEKERAYKYLNEAITMMEGTDYDLKYDNLRYYYNTIILYLLWDERLEESLEALDKLEAVVTSATGEETHISGLEEKELKRLYANRAVALARLYRTEEADECYRKFLSLGDSRDNYLIIPYLFKRGRYDEVIRLNSEREREYVEAGDTINYYMTSIRHSLGRAYFIKGNYKKAALQFERLAALRDSLKDREQRSAAIELATVYDIARKDMQIEKDAAKLRVRNVLLWTVSAIVLILVFAIWRIWRHHLIIKEKNRIQTRTIEELLESKAELEKEKADALATETAETPEAQDESSDFDRICQLLHKDNLFLDPELSRDDIIRMARVPKNKFAQIFKENTGMSFTEYVNGKRMEYAASLLKDNPHFTIEAVAKEVGLSSAQFYKLFQKRFGITPSVFRSNLSSNTLVEK